MVFNSGQAREMFILNNLNLCWFVIHKYFKFFNSRDTTQDLYQESVYALIKAIDNFDESRDSSFSSYAVVCIRLHLLKYIKLDKIIKPKRAGKELKYEIPPPVMSLNSFIDNKDNSDDNGNIEYLDFIQDDKATDNFDFVLSRISIEQFLACLSRQEIDILKLKSKLYTQQDIAKTLKISQPTVSKTMHKLKTKYKNFIEEGSRNSA